MDLELKGKRAIVTGGSRGIGKVIAWQLASEGADVVISARGEEQLKKTAKEIAAPISVRGRHWGSVRIAYALDTGLDATTM